MSDTWRQQGRRRDAPLRVARNAQAYGILVNWCEPTLHFAGLWDSPNPHSCQGAHHEQSGNDARARTAQLRRGRVAALFGRRICRSVESRHGELLARTPLSSPADVDAAVQAAAKAFPDWRRTPPGERIQYLFRLKNLLEEHIDELSRIITTENGKTFAEAKAELRRGIENVEVACGIPMLMQGYNLEDVTPGVDETLIRQPLGVVAAITPFNFPAMIPFWFLPYAIACGNTLVLKPSERVPLAMQRALELIEQTGLPKGVVNLVHGGRAVVDALCDHPQVRAISFVGSTPVAK